MDTFIETVVSQLSSQELPPEGTIVMSTEQDEMEAGFDDDYDYATATDGSTKREETDDERQLRVLGTYLASVPYPCESVEEMKQRLDSIVAKITICAEHRIWDHLVAWDGILASWLALKYPFPKATRAALAKLYWEVMLTPATDPKFVQYFATAIVRLVANKIGNKRKLELSELQLPWQTLWEAMKPAIWPKKRSDGSSRSLQNTYLQVAAICSDYFPPSDIPLMLETFLPLITPDSASTIYSLLAAFLPASHAGQYLPFLFKSWEAFHSYNIEDNVLSVLGTLSILHVAGKSSDFGPDGNLEWKDVGIYADEQWAMIMRACLASMNVPVGSSKTSSSTSQHADRSKPSVFRKAGTRLSSLAQIIIYSMSVDGPSRPVTPDRTSTERSYLAGSKALDSLDRLITSVETYFHPSNYGLWSYSLTMFLYRCCSEFSARWNDEQLPTCKTPVSQRLTTGIKAAFVEVMRTPALLSMFSKDAIAMSYANATLKHLSMLEPELVMPQLLERAYGGLESINETHRTTAAIGTLASIPAALTMRSVWPKGQKHLVPLLELCLPGIDINDGIKTISTCLFIVTALQYVKIGDLNVEGSVSLVRDAPAEDIAMQVDGAETPIAARIFKQTMTEEEIEEDTQVKHSTAGFADWVASFFRRIFVLYENLPEEGGRSGKTGGKSEEAILKSITTALDVVCANLSDSLFELALNLVYEYCTSNARSNSVRSIGNLVNSMAHARPRETMAKFFSMTKERIEIEIAGGASSVRTTSNTALPVPSDTTFHWYLAIMRATLSYGGTEMVGRKTEILSLLQTLRAAKNERGYSGVGRMLSRLLFTLTATYIVESRFVNPRQWGDPYFQRSHHHSWGKQYTTAKDVEVQWHTPTDAEIQFALEIIKQIVEPIMQDLQQLTEVPLESRDSVWRNDFCRMIYVVRSAWSGMTSFILEGPKEGADMCIEEQYIPELSPYAYGAIAGFTLTDPPDPRHQYVTGVRKFFGELLHRCAVAMNQEIGTKTDAADSVDASLQLARALDIYLLDYAVSREALTSTQRNFASARDIVKTHPKQRSFPRVVWIKRAQAYHATRMARYNSFRPRSGLDDQLILDLIDLSLSSYTRLRRHAQATLIKASQTYRRSWRLIVPRVVEALEKETSKGKDADPDRQKGALHILTHKEMFHSMIEVYPVQFILAVLHCQSQEKPSIQKLVAQAINEAVASLTEETFATSSFVMELRRLDEAVAGVKAVHPLDIEHQTIFKVLAPRAASQVQRLQRLQGELTSCLHQLSIDEQTHWRYKEYISRILLHSLSRDYAPPPSGIIQIFVKGVNSEHPGMRSYGIRSVSKLLLHVKMRWFSKNTSQLWLSQWSHPLRREIAITDPEDYLTGLNQAIGPDNPHPVLVDKERTGFMTWPKFIRGYAVPPPTGSAFTWGREAQIALDAIRELVDGSWLDVFIGRISQEAARAHAASTVDLRTDVVVLIKSIFQMFEEEFLDLTLERLDPLVVADDKYKQRAGYEIMTGVLRASKHWPQDLHSKLWTWLGSKLPAIFNTVKPDTILLWDTFLTMTLTDRDPRRCKVLLDFIKPENVDFGADSAFAITRQLTSLSAVSDTLGYRMEPQIPQLMKIYFSNFFTPYAEVRAQLSVNMGSLILLQWHPRYRAPSDLIAACSTEQDPLKVRVTDYMPYLQDYINNFAKWRLERLPPPRVSHSTYDRVGLTILQWIWGTAHSLHAASLFPYMMPLLPETFKMAELNDSSDLQLYSTAVLNVLSSIAAPLAYIEPILDNMIDAIKTSPSWRVRLSVLPVLQVFYFRNLLNLPDAAVKRVLDVLLECLRDENVEVRETAAKTLSGVIRCSQRQSILALKDRFTRLARKTRLPKRSEKEAFAEALRTLHSAVLGLCALLDAYPYSVERWGPEIIETLSRYSSDPVPVSTSIRKCAATFKQTHQDTWAMDQLMFNEDQISALATIVSGTSYYA